jgi:hypothetical protein
MNNNLYDYDIKDPLMKVMYAPILLFALVLLPSCTFFYGSQPIPESSVQSPKPLAVPVGKHWQIIEEAPQLSDEMGRPPFQTERSVQPEGAKPVAPTENRTIETTR